ncbi:MAG: hypothetical protein IPF68_16475 [Bacteroidales bacterium]|nr:hypothetical protein [Bacteroidales bacterium]
MHTYDEDLPGMVLAISADDLKKLAALASYIYNQLYGRLFDVDTSFSLPEAKVDSIISALAKTIKH